MRSTFPILICCLCVLSAVDATPFSKRGSAEVQQGNAKASKPLNFWSDDKSDHVDKDDKWGKDDKNDKDDKWSKDDDDVHYGGKGQDDCASRSVAVLIGTTTYAIPCLQGGSIVNLNGLIPTPTSSIASSSASEASSSAVSSSAFYIVKSSSSVDSSSSAASSSAASSSEASSATDKTTTTTDGITTTDTTSSANSVPTFSVDLYASSHCTGDVMTTSFNSGCFVYAVPPQSIFSAGTSSTTKLKIDFYSDDFCLEGPNLQTEISSDMCSENIISNDLLLSYSISVA